MMVFLHIDSLLSHTKPNTNPKSSANLTIHRWASLRSVKSWTGQLVDYLLNLLKHLILNLGSWVVYWAP